ncbi:MAG: hypothetical protein NHB15_09455 [Methanosarcina barkeri]|nr:hypothetical protein [Methanosarcina sp. ERenArc_MAG2]
MTGTKTSELQTKDSYLNELAGSKEGSETGRTDQIKGKYGKYGGSTYPKSLCRP